MVNLITDKPIWLYSLLSNSLLLNVVLVSLAAYWLHMRGGLKRFSVKTIKGNPPGTAVSIRRRIYHTFDSPSAVTRTIVMFGDSLIAGGLWAERYGSNVLNCGIGGETTADALLRSFDIAALHPAKVFILSGTNDFEVITPDTTVANIHKVIADLHAGSPATETYPRTLLGAGLKVVTRP